MKRFIIIAVIVFSLIAQPNLSGSNLVWASIDQDIDQLNDKIKKQRQKIEELELNISKYKKQIEEKSLEGVSLQNQLNIIDNHVYRLKDDISLSDEKIKKTELEIALLKKNIDDKEKNIEHQKGIISKIVREINANENKNYLEILITSKDLSKFYDEIKYNETIYQDLGKSAKGIRLAKVDLEKKKSLNEKYKKDQESLKLKLNNQKTDYEGQAQYKADLLEKTRSTEWGYKVLVGNLKSQYQQIENEISAYEREVQRKLAERKEIPESGGSTSLGWPTTNRYITSYFHDPEYPYRHVFEHSGIDIATSQGTPLYASGSGYVARANVCYSAACYSYTLIVHSGNLSTLYGHMSKILVSADQYVHKGDLIGYSGGTPGTIGAGPFVTGPHLHFEVRQNGIPVNALNYIK